MKKIVLFIILITVSTGCYAENAFFSLLKKIVKKKQHSEKNVHWVNINTFMFGNRKISIPTRVPMYKNKFYIRAEFLLMLAPKASVSFNVKKMQLDLSLDNLRFALKPDQSYALWDNNSMKIDGKLLMINGKPYIPLSVGAHLAYCKAVYNKQTRKIKFYSWKNRTPEYEKPTEIQAIIDKVSKIHNVPKAMIKAIIRVESNFNPKAVSRAGAIGLMQLMPATARGLGVNPHDPYQNVYGGTLYYKKMLARFKTRKLALAAYNAGPGNVNKYGGVPPFPETQNYVKKVEYYYQYYLTH